MDTITTTLGELKCRIVGSGASPEAAVVLCHGFGAPGTDLVPIGHELFRRRPDLALRVRVVFPEAPLGLESMGLWGGRAWWPLDVAEIQRAVMSGEMRALVRDEPPELAPARRMLMKTLRVLEGQTGLSRDRIVLGGFSQGSMLATDATLRMDETPAALCVWSGTVMAEETWRRMAPRRRGLRTQIAHGRQDPVLPYAGGEMLAGLLDEAGLDVEFVGFDGPHTISSASIDRLAALLTQLVGDEDATSRGR